MRHAVSSCMVRAERRAAKPARVASGDPLTYPSDEGFQ